MVTSIDPEILVLDEGLGAVDADFLEKVRDRLKEMVRRSGILVFAAHPDEFLLELCDTALWMWADPGCLVDHFTGSRQMHEGIIRESGPLREVLTHYKGRDPFEGIVAERSVPAYLHQPRGQDPRYRGSQPPVCCLWSGKGSPRSWPTRSGGNAEKPCWRRARHRRRSSSSQDEDFGPFCRATHAWTLGSKVPPRGEVTMLPDRDQQRLNEIEQELRSDRDFARRFHESRRRMPRLAPTRTLAAVAAAAALLCLALGEGIGFTAAGLLAAVLFFCHGWSIRAQ